MQEIARVHETCVVVFEMYEAQEVCCTEDAGVQDMQRQADNRGRTRTELKRCRG